jgi:hypothetical protein
MMTNDYMQQLLKFALVTGHRARELLLYRDALALRKDLFIGKSWDIQYNYEGHMALPLVKYEDFF